VAALAAAVNAVPSIDDLSLVCRCQAGDLAAFNVLVERYQGKVFNAVHRMVGHYEDARDVTQDAFCKALAALDGFRGNSGFYTWIFRIAANAAISHRRRSGRMQPAEIREETDVAGKIRRSAEPEHGPVQSAENLEAAAEVALALQKLDPEFRAALVLKDIEGCDYDEIAEILEVPLGTVKSRIHRARMEMRTLLEPMLG